MCFMETRPVILLSEPRRLKVDISMMVQMFTISRILSWKGKMAGGVTDSSHLFKMCLRGKKPRALHWRGKIPFKRQRVYNLSPHFGSKTRMGRHIVSSACVMTMLVTHQYEWFSLVSSWLLDKASLISCGIFLRSVIIWWYCIVSMNFSKLFLWEGMAQGANIPMN